MTRGARALALLLLALAPGAARADVVLSGNQHIGDGNDNALDPDDPVTRAQMRSNPSYFYLSQTTTINAVQVNAPKQLDNQLQVYIDDMAVPRPGTASGSCDDGGTCTYTLATPLTLAAGTHTIFPDGGCSAGAGFPIPCTAGENDFGFASITLASPQITLSRTFNRRTHIGDNSDASNDNYAGRYYRDQDDGVSESFSFNLETSRVLSEVRFHRMRDVAASPQTFASVSIDGVPVGTITANGDPFILSPNLTLAAGNHTLTVTAGIASGPDEDDISWDDIILVMINNPATAPGQFNAVDPGSVDVAAGSISTQVAGTGAVVDLVALTGGVPFAGYTGTLNYAIVDASNLGGSCETWPAVASGSVTFAPADAGRRTVTIPYAQVLPHARIRMHDAALALTSCSADNFAIRPHRFAGVLVTHDDPATPGTTQALASAGFAANTQPVHKAGRYFTIRATAYNTLGAPTAGYAGSPTLSAVTSVLGANLGTAGASGWTYPGGGQVRSDAAHYDEVGAVTLRLVDTTFAAVDADDPDTTNLSFGSANFDVGRFIPDHFAFTELVPAEFAPGCAADGFTYVGQPFFFTATPQAQVIARAAGGTTTTNYDGTLYKVVMDAGGGALPQSDYAAVAVAGTAFATSGIPDPDNTFVNQGNGVSLFTLLPRPGGYQFTRTSPLAPFDAEIGIALDWTEGDGVGFEATDPGRFGNAAAGEGIPFAAGGNDMRFGRLVIDSVHGSERLPLAVALRTEFYSGGFQQNLDSCTTLAAGDLLLGGSLAGPPDPPNDPARAFNALGGGRWQLAISAPNASGQVTVRAQLGTLAPWLRVGPAWAADPEGLATFGLSNDRDLRIFQREVVN